MSKLDIRLKSQYSVGSALDVLGWTWKPPETLPELKERMRQYGLTLTSAQLAAAPFELVNSSGDVVDRVKPRTMDLGAPVRTASRMSPSLIKATIEELVDQFAALGDVEDSGGFPVLETQEAYDALRKMVEHADQALAAIPGLERVVRCYPHLERWMTT